VGGADPLVAEHEDGTVDFGLMERALTLAADGRCAVCGDRFGARAAFLGGPHTVAAGFFLYPPMCQPRARAALVACPYLARRRYGRRSLPNRDWPLLTAHPKSAWYLCLTHAYEIILVADGDDPRPGGAPGRGGLLLFAVHDLEPVVERYAYTAAGRLERAPG
jgi:hypothetical protein